ncbi:hypothetical protein M1O17_00780 [Dehalococcoidia bacterium]|nr:hypothetical protein [Dehalococcoidia bacterium]
MSAIGKAKHFAIGIGVVCLLIAGGFVGYGGMPPVAAEKDISALWEEIRQSPDPGQALVALGAWDPDAMTALMQYVSQDEAAWQQFLEFEKARPHFWYEFREDGSGRISATPRYPELLEGIVCERCYYKALAEQLPEHPVMEVFYKKLNVRLDAGMPQEVKEAIFCSACLAEVGPSAEKPFPDGNPSSAAAELEPLWWRPTHHSHIGLVERVPFQWEWWFFSETNIRWPGMPASYMEARTSLRRDGTPGIPGSGTEVDWHFASGSNTRHVRAEDYYSAPAAGPGTYHTEGRHIGWRTGHDHWTVWTWSQQMTWP